MKTYIFIYQEFDGQAFEVFATHQKTFANACTAYLDRVIAYSKDTANRFKTDPKTRQQCQQEYLEDYADNTTMVIEFDPASNTQVEHKAWGDNPINNEFRKYFPTQYTSYDNRP